MDASRISALRTGVRCLLLLGIAGGASAALPPPPPPPPPLPPYPAAPTGGADERNSATVVLIIELAVDGAVRGVEIEKSSGFPKLDAAAAEGAMRWLFNPLQVDGQPAAGKVRVPVQFPLD